ncbi:MAG TPA: NlpC/P60 family protein [Trueperaceae bacterium]
MTPPPTNPIEAFEAFKRTLVPDSRMTLCDVRIEGGALCGVADKRLEADLYRFAADHRLGSRVTYPTPGRQWVLRARAALRKSPEPGAAMVSEARYGEPLAVYDRQGDYVRVATTRDDYLGWIDLTDISHHLPEPTHRFTALRGHVFAGPDVAAGRLLELSHGVALRVEAQEGDWCRVAFGKGQTGYVRGTLLEPAGVPPRPATPEAIADFARGFLQSPYVWGGVTAWGLDCSGFVQSVFAAHGLPLPRDADLQEMSGVDIDPADAKPANLLFFPGHVAISLGGSRFLHANGHHMRVTIDDFTESEYGAGLREKLTRVVRVGGIADG